MLSAFSVSSEAQQVDSIFFHLYTDSLKKGTYNYINVDGKLHDGTWFPLTDKQLSFTATGGRFEGNSLFLDTGFTPEKVIVSAMLRSDTAIAKTVTIWIRTRDDHERVKTKEEIMQEVDQPRRRRKGIDPQERR